ncbi:hypothetical protein P885DRAFT_81768 [Corynascus similis CBS 632.67]
MPAVSRAINIIARTIQARRPFEYTSPPPFPSFYRPPDDDDNDDDDSDAIIDDDSFRPDPDDFYDDEHLAGGTIAAIVVSIIVFFLVVGIVLAFLHHRRRKARKEGEVAMKEGSISVTPAPTAVSGALDPPPPYDEGQHRAQPHHHHHHQLMNDPSGASGVENEEDVDAIGSHATITDGPTPGTLGGIDVNQGRAVPDGDAKGKMGLGTGGS